MKACLKVPIGADENDSSQRLLMYCRQAKRFGLGDEECVRLIRSIELENPLKKIYSDQEIKDRYEQSNADFASGQNEDDSFTAPPETVKKKTLAETDFSWLMRPSERCESIFARRFIDRYSDDLLYCSTWAKWLVWDGKRYVVDQGSLLVMDRIIEFANSFWSALAQLGPELDQKEIGKLLTWIKKVNSGNFMSTILRWSKADLRIIVKHDELDADKQLITCRTGTYNARTTQIQPFQRRDRITMLANFDFEYNVRAPIWEKSIETIFGGDREMIQIRSKTVRAGP